MALCYPSLAALPLLTLLVTAAGAATGEGFLAAPLPINSSQPPFGSSAPARTVAAAAPSDGSGLSVVDLYGQLAVEGNAIVSNETGLPVRLRGVSLFWSQWIPKYWNAEALQWLRDDWHVAVIRAAMGIEGGGYLVNPEAEKGRVKAVVQAAIDLGIYVIIDWHDHNAESHLEEATEFFDEMAQRYGGYPNVLFEVFNEPMLQRWEDAIKPYHESLVAVIRQHTDNLIILGTRFWSQAVHGASLSPVIGENLAYTIHFYAATHRETIRDQVAQALANGVAVFATEWGTCEATGDGTLDFEEAQTWLDFFERHGISDANWAIGDKEEACAALRVGASPAGNWSRCDLTASGAFVRALLRGEAPPPAATEEECPPPPPAEGCSESGVDCRATGCCSDRSLTCFEKNPWWAGCRPGCWPGVDRNEPPQHQTPWTCKALGGAVPSTAASGGSMLP